MAKLKLYFSSSEKPELYRLSFEHPLLGEPRLSIRGKSSSASYTPYTFQWTPAVRALSVFFLRNAAWGLAEQSSVKPMLSSEYEQIAISLDYALSKQPQWLIDSFGTDTRERALARRLFHRTNPERKRPGPVILNLNEHSLPATDIKIFWNSQPVTSSETILQMANKVTNTVCKSSSYLSRKLPAGSFKTQTLQDNRPLFSQRLVANLIEQETMKMLWNTDIFNTTSLKQTDETLAMNPSVLKLTKQKTRFRDSIDCNLSSAQRFGMGATEDELKRVINQDEPIRVVVPYMVTAGFVIFEYLKRHKGYNIDIDYEWGYTAEVRRAQINHRFQRTPDLVAHGIGPSATIMGQPEKHDCRPLMFLPSISHRIITPNHEKYAKTFDLNHGEYLFLCEEASTPEFCFENMERQKKVSRAKVATAHLEPDEATKLLQEGNPDLRLLMFFPHYSLNELFNKCTTTELPRDHPRDDPNFQEIVLFASDKFLHDINRALCMNIAIRNAWLELRHNKQLLANTTAEITEEERFMKFFSRASGLHNLSDINAP